MGFNTSHHTSSDISFDYKSEGEGTSNYDNPALDNEGSSYTYSDSTSSDSFDNQNAGANVETVDLDAEEKMGTDNPATSQTSPATGESPSYEGSNASMEGSNTSSSTVGSSQTELNTPEAQSSSSASTQSSSMDGQMSGNSNPNGTTPKASMEGNTNNPTNPAQESGTPTQGANTMGNSTQGASSGGQTPLGGSNTSGQVPAAPQSQSTAMEADGSGSDSSGTTSTTQFFYFDDSGQAIFISKEEYLEMAQDLRESLAGFGFNDYDIDRILLDSSLGLTIPERAETLYYNIITNIDDDPNATPKRKLYEANMLDSWQEELSKNKVPGLRFVTTEDLSVNSLEDLDAIINATREEGNKLTTTYFAEQMGEQTATLKLFGYMASNNENLDDAAVNCVIGFKVIDKSGNITFYTRADEIMTLDYKDVESVEDIHYADVFGDSDSYHKMEELIPWREEEYTTGALWWTETHTRKVRTLDFNQSGVTEFYEELESSEYENYNPTVTEAMITENRSRQTQLQYIRNSIDSSITFQLEYIDPYIYSPDYQDYNGFDENFEELVHKDAATVMSGDEQTTQLLTDPELKVAYLSSLFNNKVYIFNQCVSIDDKVYTVADGPLFDHYISVWHTVLTDNEKKIFNYLANHPDYGPEAALAYLEEIADTIDQRYTSKMNQLDAEWARKNPVLASIASVIITPFEGIGAFFASLSALSTNHVWRSDIRSSGTNYRSAVSEMIRYKMVDDKFLTDATGALVSNHPKWAFIYDTGMSIADSGVLILAGVATGGGSFATQFVLSTLLMGSRVYVSSLNDALDRGVPPRTAVAYAFGTATIESLMEAYSLGHLMGLEGKLGKVGLAFRNKISRTFHKPWATAAAAILTAMISQGLCEGEEELCTEILDFFWDEIICDEKSEFSLTVDRYVANGESYEDAFAHALLDKKDQCLQAFQGGFLSGICFGGGKQIFIITTTNNNVNVKNNNNNNTDTTTGLSPNIDVDINPVITDVVQNNQEIVNSDIVAYGQGLNVFDTAQIIPISFLLELVNDPNYESMMNNGNLDEKINGYDKVMIAQALNQLLEQANNKNFTLNLDEAARTRMNNYIANLNMTELEVKKYLFKKYCSNMGPNMREFLLSKEGVEAYKIAKVLQTDMIFNQNSFTEEEIIQINHLLDRAGLVKNVIIYEGNIITLDPIFIEEMAQNDRMPLKNYRFIQELADFNNYKIENELFRTNYEIAEKVLSGIELFQQKSSSIFIHGETDFEFWTSDEAIQLYEAAKALLDNDYRTEVTDFFADENNENMVHYIYIQMGLFTQQLVQNGVFVNLNPLYLEFIAEHMVNNPGIYFREDFEFFNALLQYNNYELFESTNNIYQREYLKRTLDQKTIKRLKKFFGDKITEDQLNKILDSLVLGEETDFEGHNDNTMGYNDGKRSVIRAKLSLKTIIDTFNHESLHQISYKALPGPRVGCYMGVSFFDGKNTYHTGFNEAITEYFNMLSMEEEYEAKGYPALENAMEELVAMGVFTVDGLQTAYLNNDISYIRKAIAEYCKNNGMNDMFDTLSAAFDEYVAQGCTADAAAKINALIAEMKYNLIKTGGKKFNPFRFLKK